MNKLTKCCLPAFAITLLLPILVIGQRAAEPKVMALVVGVSRFRDKSIEELNLPRKDAEAFYRLLKTPICGSVPDENITVLLDSGATRPNIMHALSKTISRLTEEDMLIFYFSGHGNNGNFDHDGYFMSYDAVKNDEEGTALSMEEVYRKIAGSRAKLKVSYIDACHAAKYVNNKSGVKTKGSESQVDISAIYKQSVINANSGNVSFMSSNAEQVSYEIPKFGNSVFTWYLIEGLSGKADTENAGAPGYNDGIVTAPELQTYLSKYVEKETNFKQRANTVGVFDESFPLSIIDPSVSLTKLIFNEKIKVPETKVIPTKPEIVLPADQSLSSGFYYFGGSCFGGIGFVNGTLSSIVVTGAYERGTVPMSPFAIAPGKKGETTRLPVGASSEAKDCGNKAMDYTFYLEKKDPSGATLYANMRTSVESCKRKWILLEDDSLIWTKTNP